MSHTRLVCTVSRQGCLQRGAGLPSPQRPTGGGQLALQEEVPRDAPHWETGGAFPWGGEEKEPAGVESGGGEAPRGSGLGPCANSPLSTRQEAGAGRAVVPGCPTLSLLHHSGLPAASPHHALRPVPSMSAVSSLRPLDLTVWLSRPGCGPCSAGSCTKLNF